MNNFLDLFLFCLDRFFDIFVRLTNPSRSYLRLALFSNFLFTKCVFHRWIAMDLQQSGKKVRESEIHKPKTFSANKISSKEHNFSTISEDHSVEQNFIKNVVRNLFPIMEYPSASIASTICGTLFGTHTHSGSN